MIASVIDVRSVFIKFETAKVSARDWNEQKEIVGVCHNLYRHENIWSDNSISVMVRIQKLKLTKYGNNSNGKWLQALHSH